MTATVVTTYARTPIAGFLTTESIRGLSDADMKQRCGMIYAAGQLWERIAETTPNLATLSHATTAAIWEVGCRPKWRDERGPQSRPIHHSGVIRARQRIK